MKTAGLACWMMCCALGALAGGGGAPKIPVQTGLRSMEISCGEAGEAEEQAPRAVKLSFALNFGVAEPFDLNGNGQAGGQSLEAEDSTGRKLGAVTFDVWNLHTRKRGKIRVTMLKGECPELPSPETEWIRLHGTLRLPVTREVPSPVYDFSLSEGAVSFPVTLAGPEEEPQECAGDLAVAGDAGTEELSVKVARRMGEKWLLEAMLWNDKGYRITSWELMDGDGKPLKADFVSGIISRDSGRSGTGQSMAVDAGTDLGKLKIRLYRKEDMGTVPLPVDMKMGLDGTVRE